MVRKTNKFSLAAQTRLNKTLAIIGLTFLLFTIIATAFTFGTSHSFVNGAFDVSYYGRYALTLLGGFGIGLLFALLSRRTQDTKNQVVSTPVLTGISFGMLTFFVYLLLDLARLPICDLFGDPVYPWGMIIFQGMPLAALIIVTVFAGVAFLKRSFVSISQRWLQLTLVSLFVLQQIATLISVGFISSDAELSGMTILLGALALVITPLSVSVIAYAVLARIKETALRLFTAAAIGAFYQLFTLIAWEFRTNPEHQATLVFGTVVSIASYIVAAVMILLARFATRTR